MFAQLRSRQISFAFLAVLLALSTLLLITSITFARPAGTIIVNPGDSIQAAINSATPGDTIVINAGTYTESLTLNKAVSLTGVNSTTVIIHAVTNHRVLTVTGSVIDASVVISGLTFTGGNTFDSGGGIEIVNNARPLIQSVVITGNYANSDFGGYGGGIYSTSPLTLRNVTFSHNEALEGGGLYADGNHTVVMTDCLFFGNRGLRYGGAHITGDATVVNSRFEDNFGSGLTAGAAFISDTQFISNTTGNWVGYGGGVGGGSIVAVNALFERNTADYSGGGINASTLVLTNTRIISNSAFLEGCGVRADSVSITGGEFIGNQCITTGVWTNWGIGGGLYAGQLTLTNVDFISNSAPTNGGVHAYSSAIVVGGRFERNSSLSPWTGTGGGMAAVGSLIMTGTQFISNTALVRGGGLDLVTQSGAQIVNTIFADNMTSGDGAGIYVYTGAPVSLLHVIFANTSPNPKQGIYVSYLGDSLRITNTIISDYAVGLERQYSYVGNVFEDYNLFYGNTTNLSGTVIGGAHDVFSNPHFVDPANNDYHITSPSAAIDAGVDAGVYTDLDGNVRPSGGGFDIGAYEAAIATVPITGLVAVNDSPTRLGEATMFVASVQAGDSVSYRWDFGDGSALDHYQTVAHTYPSTGIYTAIVTASNSLSTVTATTNITVYVTPITGLVAINSSPNVLNQPTAFTATIAAGDLVTYTWNFGDSSSTGAGITSTHAYSTVGVYTATVTAINSVSVVSATTRVTITDVPLSGLSASNNSPSAIGSATTLTATIDAGSHVTYTWNFGDGSPAVLGQVVTHTYPLSVTAHFTATVAATNSINTQAATTMVIIVPKRVCLPVLIR